MATLLQRIRSLLGFDNETEDQKTEGENQSGSIWDITPDWQRYGRFDGGGITRGEQEQVIKDIQQQAEEAEQDVQQDGHQ